MSKKNRNMTIQGTNVGVKAFGEQDYISITDMLSAKDGEFFVADWLRNGNTLDYIGIWERYITQVLIMANSPQLE